MANKFTGWSPEINLWKTWWADLTTWKRVKPLALLVVYWAIIARFGTLTSDHFLPLIPIAILYYLGPRFRSAFEFLLPLVLMLVVYDSQRMYADYIRGPIHVREPHDFDIRFFGIHENGRVYTPAAWFQIHTHWLLDLITGFFYIAFVPIFVFLTAYMRFFLSRKGTAKCSAEYIRLQSPQIMWTFFWLNVVGFSTYYWYAASPPWYADMYGFGPAQVHVPASPAGCARFDALLGTHIFDQWYGKAADVHGAIPSLHIAYPLVSVYYAFKFGALRWTSVQYFLWLCFSAIYLNQHYVLDVLIGSVYAIAASVATDWAWNRWKVRKRPAEELVMT
jgi:inositol phosphorylceramide synthase catalytic subunit